MSLKTILFFAFLIAALARPVIVGWYILGREGTHEQELESGEIYFTSKGEKVKALLFVPDNWNEKCVILVHGLGGSKETWIKEVVVKELVDNGYCCLIFDLPLHGERVK